MKSSPVFPPNPNIWGVRVYACINTTVARFLHSRHSGVYRTPQMTRISFWEKKKKMPDCKLKSPYGFFLWSPVRPVGKLLLVVRNGSFCTDCGRGTNSWVALSRTNAQSSKLPFSCSTSSISLLVIHDWINASSLSSLGPAPICFVDDRQSNFIAQLWRTISSFFSSAMVWGKIVDGIMRKLVHVLDAAG